MVLETPQRIVLIVGARPNFMKAAPLLAELGHRPEQFEPILIHTGQHYDHNLSQLFFDDLGLPRPDRHLGVGSGSHSEQTARIMVELERSLLDLKPSLVVAFGDVNSTLAAAVTAAKMVIPVAHVEAGLRSFDKTMPEEINRIVTDRLSDFLFVTEPVGMTNLAREGVPAERMFLVGNLMIDTLKAHLRRAETSEILTQLGLEPRGYCLTTMHRPSNVDDPAQLAHLSETLIDVARRLPVLFPCHPRTRTRFTAHGMGDKLAQGGVHLIDPVGYLDFLHLEANARLVITDSGGVQEETSCLGVPCLTLRTVTELLVTVEQGTNTLVGSDRKLILQLVETVLNGRYKTGTIPALWDGRAAERTADILAARL